MAASLPRPGSAQAAVASQIPPPGLCRGLLRNLVRDREPLASLLQRQPIPHGVPLLQDSLDRAERWKPGRRPALLRRQNAGRFHQMRPGNVNTPFPENLRDPVDAETAAMRLQDLFLILSQCVDLGLLSITAAFRAARDLKKILGSGFEISGKAPWTFHGPLIFIVIRSSQQSPYEGSRLRYVEPT